MKATSNRTRVMMLALAGLCLCAAPFAQDRPSPPGKRAKATVAAPSQAVHDLETRAGNGDRDAQYELGERYRSGRDVDMDAAVALMWYFRAAKQGHKDARVHVRDLAALVAPAPPPAPDNSTSPPATRNAGPVRVEREGSSMAIALALAALLVSFAAMYFSWSRTRQALRDAGLL